MILILSNNTDASTNNVIDWLDCYKIRWWRINEDDKVEITRVQIQADKEPEIDLLVNGEALCLKEVKGYWYRRGRLNTPLPFIKTDNDIFTHHIRHHVSNELNYTVRFIHQYLAAYKKSISNFLTAENDKLRYLLLASEVGLDIPETLICNSGDHLIPFQKQHNSIITKSIHELISVPFADLLMGSRTYKLEAYAAQREQFLLSLFQNNVDKLYELRIFFLTDEIYSMAIFSQENEQTKVDFRNYDDQRPNRRVPYKLPALTEEKLRLFIEKSGLNSGSIDMIVTTDMRHVFLEVNPIGQFGMVSYPCNYFLEKKIAQYFQYE
jgi:ATP-GRASP peptide maturase of grasp-with-spasm system